MIDINPHHLSTVSRILAEHLPGCEVRAFGSRATWTAKDYSDLDLAIVCTGAIDPDTLARLREAFEESDLPFRVDVIDWNVTSESFRKVIERKYEIVQSGRQRCKSVAGEWTTVRLGDVTDLLTGFPFKSEAYTEDVSAPRLLRGDNVIQGVLRWDSAKRWPKKSTDDVAPYWLTEGDVVVAMDRPWIESGLKYAAIRKADLPALLVQRVARLRGRGALDTRFLKYVIGSRAFTEYVLAVQTGTAVPHISGGQIRSFEFRLPPIDEQGAIANILGTLDDKIELNRRMNETLEAMARALFKSWFVDFDPVRAKAENRDTGLAQPIADLFPDSFEDSELGEIPKGWPVNTIRELASCIQYGLTQSASSDPVGPRFVRITDIQGGRVDWRAVPYCRVTAEEYGRYCIKAGDVLVARTGASTGENIYLSAVPEAVFASYLVRFQFTDQAMARLVGAFMRTPAYFEFVAASCGGSAQPNASAQLLASAKLAAPTVEVARRYREAVSSWDAKALTNASESATLAALRDTLLPKLISGEVRLTHVDRA